MTTKTHRIYISDNVQKSLKKQADYIAFEQQNPVIAEKWLDGLVKAIESLSTIPNRCPIAPENSYIYNNSKSVIRHFIYKKSFRIIFTVVKNEVRILSVKHGAQLPF